MRRQRLVRMQQQHHLRHKYVGNALFLRAARLRRRIRTLIPFVIPGLCLIAYLFLTEKSLRKPWVEERINRWMERHTDEMADPRHMEQRRLLSGALWLLAIALFVTLGFIVGFQYSWVTFLFAVAGELVIEYRLRAGAR